MLPELTILFDGGCPLCNKEILFLKRKDIKKKLNYVDINDEKYNPNEYLGITYSNAMSRVHGITSDNQIIKDLEVFYKAYKAIGLGWIYAPTKIPILKECTGLIYTIWAKYRLKITKRAPLEELCRKRESKRILEIH